LDGGSADGTCEIVAAIAQADARVRLIDNPKRLQSAAVNLAARTFASGRRWLVRVDAHADYPPRYVSRLVREAERSGAQSVVVAMRTEGHGLFQRAVAVAQNSRLGTGGSAHRGGGPSGFVDHGHHALFETSAFLRAGGYDEGFSHNEDAEFDVRLRRSGGRIWLTRDLEIAYFPRSRPGPLFRQYRSYGRGRARTLLRHKERPRLRQLLPLAVAPALIALAAAPWLPLAAAPALAWALICLAYGAGLAIRTRAAEALLSGPAAMIMHVGWSIGFWSLLIETARPRAPLGVPAGPVVAE
jgi:succinoglycan biosynthesis protein ExoA